MNEEDHVLTPGSSRNPASDPTPTVADLNDKSSHKRKKQPSSNDKGGKRKKKPSSNDEGGKRKKQPSSNDEEGGRKKKKFERCFSLEDEISLLHAIIEFKKRGLDPKDDFASFHGSIRKSLHFNASRRQLAEKVRHLKRKFMANLYKPKRKVNGNVFSAPIEHEKILHELSKKIWGRSSENVEEGLELPQSESNDSEDNEPDRRKGALYPFLLGALKSGGVLSNLGMGEEMAKRRLEEMNNSDAKCLDEKCKKLQLEAAKVCVGRAEVAAKQMKLFLAAVTHD